MNTKTRGNKNHDVTDAISEVWKDRLKHCLEETGYTRKEFASAFKDKYGTGNIADVSRWFNVGSTGKNKTKIGLPSYDTMKRIADFFDVTVGYLTGETDYKSFDMERACSYLGINEAAGIGIKKITSDSKYYHFEERFGPFSKENNTTALCYLISSEYFFELTRALAIHLDFLEKKNKGNLWHLANTLPAETFQLAFELRDCHHDDPEAQNISPDIENAIREINHAMDEDYADSYEINEQIELSEYRLQKIYFELLEEISELKHKDDMLSNQG